MELVCRPCRLVDVAVLNKLRLGITFPEHGFHPLSQNDAIGWWLGGEHYFSRSSRRLQKWHGFPATWKLRSQYAHMAHVASDVERMSVVMFHFEINLTCHRHLCGGRRPYKIRWSGAQALSSICRAGDKSSLCCWQPNRRRVFMEQHNCTQLWVWAAWRRWKHISKDASSRSVPFRSLNFGIALRVSSFLLCNNAGQNQYFFYSIFA